MGYTNFSPTRSGAADIPVQMRKIHRQKFYGIFGRQIRAQDRQLRLPILNAGRAG